MAAVCFHDALDQAIWEYLAQTCSEKRLRADEIYHSADNSYWHLIKDTRPQVRYSILLELLSHRQELRLELRHPIHMDCRIAVFLENCFWSRKGTANEYLRLQEHKFLSPRVKSLVKLEPSEKARGQEMKALPLEELTACLRKLQTQEDLDDDRVSDEEVVLRTYMRVLAAKEWKDQVNMSSFSTELSYQRPEPDPVTKRRYPKPMIEIRSRSERPLKTIGRIEKLKKRHSIRKREIHDVSADYFLEP